MSAIVLNYGSPYPRSRHVLVPDGSAGIWQGTKAIQRLPSEAVGYTTVTFAGVVAGVEIRVFNSELDELAGIESCSQNQILTWPVYAEGSENNNVRIKIIGLAYKIKDFPYTSQAGSVVIPIQLEHDPWASNP